MLGVLSDKQTGGGPALGKVFPHCRHQWCQAHDLRNLAAPLADADTTCKGEVRKAARHDVGELVRQAPRPEPNPAGVLTVTDLWPSPLDAPKARATDAATPTAQADEIITNLFRHPHYLRTLKGHPPFRLAGLHTYEHLQNVVSCRLELLSTHYDPRLAQFSQGIEAALSPLAKTSEDIQQGAAGLHDLTSILEPSATSPRSADTVASQLRRYLDVVRS